MANYRVHSIVAFSGNQIWVSLEDESTGQTEWDGMSRGVRIPITEAPAVIGQLMRAYAECMQNTLVEVAAGGCRTCGNTRRVNRDAFTDLADIINGTKTGEPCPVCMPRAEQRIRKTTFIGKRHSE